MTCKFLRLIVVIACVIAGLSPYSHAQDDSSSREYMVKAAMLYKFAKFVEWPDKSFADPGSPIVLCIIGEDQFGDALDPIKGKTVSGRDIVIKRNLKAEHLKECHIVFISPSEKYRLPKIMETLKDSNVLTVSDIDMFAERGGIITLVTVDNKVRFEINMEAAQRAELKISSKLLKLATIVK